MTTKKIRTMEEFAISVGISRPTVSKFFQDPKSVREKTRLKIDAALQDTGFRPNIFAVNLNRRRTKIIGLIVPDNLDPFYMALARRIELSASDAGYLVLMLNSHGQPEHEERAIATITDLNVGGAVIAPLGLKSHRSKLKALGKKIPLVFIDSPLDQEESFVGTNNAQSMTLITEYLCRSGDAPTFFDVPITNYNAVERRKTYTTTMQRLGLEPRFVKADADDAWEFERQGYNGTNYILANGGFPTKTILCPNDRIAIGVIAALNESGAKIGIGAECDYRVAGHDNQPFAAFTSPPLTTVSQNFDLMGQIALNLLFQKMDQPDAIKGTIPEGDRVLLNAELVFRKSA